MIESGLNHKISHEATKGYQNASIISQQLILRLLLPSKMFYQCNKQSHPLSFEVFKAQSQNMKPLFMD